MRLTEPQLRALRRKRWTAYEVNPKTSLCLEQYGLARRDGKRGFEITEAGEAQVIANDSMFQKVVAARTPYMSMDGPIHRLEPCLSGFNPHQPRIVK